MRPSSWYRVAAAAAILIVLINTWFAVHALRTLVEAEKWRSHTLEVLTHTESLALESRSADSAMRAYLLTGNPVYEQRFRVASAGMYQEIDTVRDLTEDNKSQLERIAFTRARVSAKIASLEAGMAIRHTTGGNLDPRLLEPVLTDSPDGGPTVFYCIGQLEGEEQRLLAQRTAAADRAQNLVRWTFLGASVLDLLLIIAAARLLLVVNRERQMLSIRSQQVANLNEELQTLNADLERRVDLRTRELELANKELEAFSYSVSHDLRAPLRTIDGFSLALQEDYADKLDDQARDFIGRVRGGVQRMGALIDALLQLSRVTRAEPVLDRVDLSQLVTLVFNEIHAGEPSRDIELVAEPGVMAKADPRLLRVALENLIGNAFKFTSKTPQARILFGSQRGPEGQTVYFLKDNGAGFDMQYVDRLFTAFQRLHGDRDFKGSGIGLATVARVIRRHHGTIWAEGKIGEGATFFFTLAA